MKKIILATCAFAALSTLSTVAYAGGNHNATGTITTTNAKNGSYTGASAGKPVDVSGCTTDGSGESRCTPGVKAKGGEVAKTICDVAEDLNLTPDSTISLATPCGKQTAKVKECCFNATPGGWSPKPNKPGAKDDNQCVFTKRELDRLKEQGKCKPDRMTGAMTGGDEDDGLYEVAPFLSDGL